MTGVVAPYYVHGGQKLPVLQHQVGDSPASLLSLTLDMLYWSEPKWVSDSGGENGSSINGRYEARYQWFKDTLNAAYEELGLKFDFVSPNRNEREVSPSNSSWGDSPR